MSESDVEDRVVDEGEEAVSEETEETSAVEDAEEDRPVSSEDALASGDDDEITPDELGIDLDSLTINSPNMLGKAKPRPSLTTSQDKRPVGRPPKEDEGVFAWCEQFNYTPGVEYLKLMRLYPKTWEGMSIGGFIEEVYEPIDEHWLADRWGGGSFQLESYQRDSTGRSRKTQVKHVEISGVPKAFMGTDGRPHLLPSQVSRSHSSRRSSDVLRRRMGLGRFRRDEDDTYEDTYDESRTESIPRPRPTANVDKPLTDASTVYKMIQDTKKSENDALGVLREAQKDVHTQMQATSQQQAEMYRTLLDQQKEEMRRMREESSRAAENSSAPFKEMLKFVTSQGSSSNTRENMDALRQAHDSAIQSLTREHNAHIDNLRRSAETRQTELMDELNRLRTSYTQDVQRIRTEYLDKEKTSKDDAFRQYQTQVQLVQTQNAELRERHRDELSTLSREKNEMIAALRQDLSEIRQALLTKEHESRMAIMERETSIRNELRDRERELQDRVNALESQGRTNLLDERQRAREEFEDRYNTKLEAMQTSFETRLENVTQSATLRVETAQKEAKSAVDAAQKEARSAVDIAKKEISAQYESQVTRLEAQLDSLKKDFQAREQLSLERSRMEQESAQKDRENQRLILESTAQSREALAEMTRKQLESRVRELTKDLDRARQDQETLAQQITPESNDPFEQLEKLNAIKDRLKAHGFIDSADKEPEDSEPAEEKPKDLLGKIMHYGPQFIGPILQRVDAATAVAQQAVHQQQQQQDVLKSRDEVIQQQRMIEMEQQAAVNREVALRERREMLLQRRMEREQALAAEDAQRQAMAEQIQQSRQQVQPQTVEFAEPVEPAELEVQPQQNQEAVVAEPVYEEAVTMSEETNSAPSEGYVKLADYLNGALEEGKNAGAIVGELKMALMMKMFSRDVLNEVLAEDFDTLVGIVGGIHPRLKSPKSRLILKDVIKGMK